MKALLSRLRRWVRAHRRPIAALLAAASVWAGLVALRPPQPATVPVVVAARALHGGATVQAGDLTLRQLPVDQLPSGHIRDPVQVIGRPLAVPLPAGTVLLPSFVVTRNSLAGPGMVALPVSLTATARGLVQVGDRIDLIAASSDSDSSTVVAAAARVLAVLADGGSDRPLAPANAGTAVLVELRPDAVAKVAARAGSGPLAFGLR